MIVTKIQTNGNSSKFHVTAKNGDFIIALSFTLRSLIWKLSDDESELVAAQDLAEAIVSRHDPTIPFKKIYIFAEHNSNDTLSEMIKNIRKHGL